MTADNLDLFAEPECDHLPVRQRVFIGDWLVCGRCGAKLRLKNYISEESHEKGM